MRRTGDRRRGGGTTGREAKRTCGFLWEAPTGADSVASSSSSSTPSSSLYITVCVSLVIKKVCRVEAILSYRRGCRASAGSLSSDSSHHFTLLLVHPGPDPGSRSCACILVYMTSSSNAATHALNFMIAIGLLDLPAVSTCARKKVVLVSPRELRYL